MSTSFGHRSVQFIRPLLGFCLSEILCANCLIMQKIGLLASVYSKIKLEDFSCEFFRVVVEF